jgi:hypothetical protein
MWFLVWTAIASTGEIQGMSLGRFDSYDACMIELHNAENAVNLPNETLSCLESVHET